MSSTAAKASTTRITVTLPPRSSSTGSGAPGQATGPATPTFIETLYGSWYGDGLGGDDEHNIIHGYDGNDVVVGRGGND